MRPLSSKFFVGGLAPSVSEAEFRQHFEQYGEVRATGPHLNMYARGLRASFLGAAGALLGRVSFSAQTVC